MTLENYTYDVELADATAVVCDAWRLAWSLPPALTVSQWADRYRWIAPGAGAEPGPWRTSRTPYLREIQDNLSAHSPIREVSFKKSAQIGATEVMINWVGYVIDHAPDSMIVAQPVKDLARSWATAKFDPAVALMPALAEKIESNNTLEKKYPGGTMWVIWANSSNQLRQRTARYLAEDELDEYPDDLGGQGSADEQLEARPLSFGDRGKIYRACTPTVAGSSKIAKRFNEGDQRYYLVPCPHCGAHFAASEELLQDNGTFVCGKPDCGVLIEEHLKDGMLLERSPCGQCGDVPVRVIHHAERSGALIYADQCGCGVVLDPGPPNGAYWNPTNPEADPLHRSYFIWAAYTPHGLGLTWREIAERRAEAAANPEKQAGYTNLICGLEFAGERQQQDTDEVQALAEPGVHLGRVPRGALILTAGIDCQHDRFEVQVVGWGRGQRGRVIDYAVINGDPSLPDGYDELDKYLTTVWQNECGMALAITALAIDGGNWTEMVAQYVKKKVSFSGNGRLIQTTHGYQKQRMFLVRGRSEKKSDRAVYKPKKSEVNQRDRTVAKSVGVWGVGTSVLKHIIYGWLGAAIAAKALADKEGTAEDITARMIRFPGGEGGAHDPLRPDPGALRPTYFIGLTCEYYDLETGAWVTPKGARNEPLDTLEYALWAALSPAIKIDTIREPQWAALEAALEPVDDLFNRAKDSRETPDKPAADPERQLVNDSRETQPVAAAPVRKGWGEGNSNRRGWGK